MDHKKIFYVCLIPFYLMVAGCGDSYKRTYYVGEFSFAPIERETDCKEICSDFRNLRRQIDVNDMIMGSCDGTINLDKKFYNIFSERNRMLEGREKNLIKKVDECGCGP